MHIAVGVYYVSNPSLHFNFVEIIESYAHEVIIIAYKRPESALHDRDC